jgi:hypothetical protein
LTVTTSHDGIFAGGHKRIALPGLPWSPEFMAAYQRAVDGSSPAEIAAGRTKLGSIDALAIAYYASAEFKQLAPISQSTAASTRSPRSKNFFIPN